MKSFTAVLLASAITASISNLYAAHAQQAPPWQVGSVVVAEQTQAPLQVARSAIVEADAAAVFELLADHQNLPKLSPMVSAVDIEGDGGAGSVRTTTLANGPRSPRTSSPSRRLPPADPASWPGLPRTTTPSASANTWA